MPTSQLVEWGVGQKSLEEKQSDIFTGNPFTRLHSLAASFPQSVTRMNFWHLQQPEQKWLPHSVYIVRVDFFVFHCGKISSLCHRCFETKQNQEAQPKFGVCLSIAVFADI